jgi:predicted  nucleic acid-binding Zn-ribbon protein
MVNNVHLLKDKLQVNMMNTEQSWLTLKEASDITGFQIPTLRQGIKRGKYLGKKVQFENRDVWLIDRDSLGICFKFDGEHFQVNMDKNVHNEHCIPEQTGEQPGEHSLKLLTLLVGEKDKRLSEQAEHIGELRTLMGHFIERIKNLEYQNENLLQQTEQVKLLPEPIEEIRVKLEELENVKTQIQEVTGENESLVGEKTSMKNQIDHLSSQLTERCEAEAMLQGEKSKLEDELAKKDRELENARTEAEKIEMEKKKILEELTEIRTPWWKKMFKKSTKNE